VGPTGDYLIADEIAARVAERTNSLVAPVIPFGNSEYFRSFPGTISLRSETLAPSPRTSASACSITDSSVCCSSMATAATIHPRRCRAPAPPHRGVRIITIKPGAFRPPALLRQLYGEDVTRVLGHGGEPLASMWLHLRPS